MRATRRAALSSLLTSLSERVGRAVTTLVQQSPLLADERCVTELRRRYVPRRSSARTLAQRLRRQRVVQQSLVPRAVTIDSTRQYVSFVWPAHAAALMQRQLDRAHARSATRRTDNNDTDSDNDDDSSDDDDDDDDVATVTPDDKAASDDVVHTRALAEYLRVMSPSTDNGNGIVLYGRRGVTIRDVVPMGNYALRFVFGDGHDGGIYSYEYLYALTTSPYKYTYMRAYVRQLRARRKSRDPPRRRAASTRRLGADGATPAPDAHAATATTPP